MSQMFFGMFSRSLFGLLCALVLSSSAKASETKLLGVELGYPYSRAVKVLEVKHGPPIQKTASYRSFLVDEKARTVLAVTKLAKADEVSAVDLLGTLPVKGIRKDFLLNLGDAEKLLLVVHPNLLRSDAKEGFTRYYSEFSNYYFETKNGKISGLFLRHNGMKRITKIDRSRSWYINRTQDSILPARPSAKKKKARKRWEVRFKQVIDDPLRSQCFARKPLYSIGDHFAFWALVEQIKEETVKSKNGDAVEEKTVIKVTKQIPGLMWLHTAWPLTSFSRKICKAWGCQPPSKNRLSSRKYQSFDFDDKRLAYGPFLLQFDDVGVSTKMKSDKTGMSGILGTDSIQLWPFFVNFKDEYVCFLEAAPSRKAFGSFARSMGFAELPVEVDDGEIWLNGTYSTDLISKKRVLKKVRLNTGGHDSSLPLRDLNRLWKKHLSREAEQLKKKQKIARKALDQKRKQLLKESTFEGQKLKEYKVFLIQEYRAFVKNQKIEVENLRQKTGPSSYEFALMGLGKKVVPSGFPAHTLLRKNAPSKWNSFVGLDVLKNYFIGFDLKKSKIYLKPVF